jgi:HD-GYP domain-containing protein (c-di-GMP phosphodiesterase class II)/DNA-binding CsgD family transcriptional regulator
VGGVAAGSVGAGKQSEFRLAELVAAISLASDLGMGQPMEQALRTCLISIGLGERLALNADELSEVYYVALLRFLGCTADGPEVASVNLGDDIALRAAIAPLYGAAPPDIIRGFIPKLGEGQPPLRRVAVVAGFMATGLSRMRAGLAAHCEVAEHLAQRLGLASGIRLGLAQSFERWGGRGYPGAAKGEKIALSARIVTLARDAEVLNRVFGTEEAVAVVSRRRKAGTYDPSLSELFAQHGSDLLQQLEERPCWEAVLAAEPSPYPWVPESHLDSILEVFADFADFKSAYTAGHSREVSRLGALAAGQFDSVLLRRAGLVHDLGRVGIPSGVWDKRGAFGAGEWERVRLHAYYTERVLLRSPALAPLAPYAALHHERLDGSGYHRGCPAADIPRPARTLAAADAYQAMSQERPHRRALTPQEAAAQLASDVAKGRLDRDAVEAVLQAAGQPVHVPRELPAGLSERELEVLRLICRGKSKKEAAKQLYIAPSTVDHHIRHIYEKVGVSTRAGAVVFALEHDLLS